MPENSLKVVSYEKLIGDPEAVLNELFEWLGVDSDCAACRRPNATAAAFTSAGAIALRAPAFHLSGLEGWARYEPFLEAEVFPHLGLETEAEEEG